jgi:predicted ArsR family transcriptional regulator
MFEKEREAVERAVLDYVKGAYNNDPSLTRRSVHPRLAKLGFIQKDGQYVEHPMTFDELVEIVKTYNQDSHVPQDAPKKVTVYEVLDQTASAKLEAWWGIDYVHLARFDGKWMIVNVLWQTFPDDAFHTHVSWVAEWFAHDKRGTLPFTDQGQQTVFDELTSLGWKEPDIIAQLDALYERFGAKLIQVIEMAVAENNRRDWAEIARRETGHTIDDLIRLLWEPGRERGCEYIVETREDGVQIHCTHCPFAELGKRIDGTKWLYHLVCMGDPYIVEGFNPDMGFRRTKTLMEGHECCDHFYFMKA